jgi:hypothetical protein
MIIKNYQHLAIETKLKYGISLLGVVISFSLIAANDIGLLKLSSNEFYKITLATCAYSFRIVDPKYKEDEQEAQKTKEDGDA